MNATAVVLAALIAGPDAHSGRRVWIEPSELPPPVRETLKKSFGEAQQLGFFRTTQDDGQLLYVAKLVDGAHRFKVFFKPEGAVVREASEVPFTDVPREVQRALAASKYVGWEVRRTEQIIENDKASTMRWRIIVAEGPQCAALLYSPAGELLREKLKACPPWWGD